MLDKAMQAIYAVQHALVRDQQSFIKEGEDDVLADMDVRRLPTRRQDSRLVPLISSKDCGANQGSQ